jgi:Domain of unknown function (DUF4365)
LATRREGIRAKIRTRQHIIADLSFNYFQRWVLECGDVAEPVWHDYGYDVIIFTYTPQGELEPGQILVQLKATDRLRVLRGGRMIACTIDRRDLKVWLREADPVIFVVYDAQKRRAYWLHVQQYFREFPTKDLFAKGDSVTVRIPTSNRVNRRSIQRFAAFRDETLK